MRVILDYMKDGIWDGLLDQCRKAEELVRMYC